MKFKSLVAIAAVSILFASCGKDGGSQSTLTTAKDSTSYALGALQTQGMMDEFKARKVFQFLDANWMLKGAQDRIDDKSLIDNNQARTTIGTAIQGVMKDSTFTLPVATEGDVMANGSDSLSYALGSQIIEGILTGAEQLNVTDKIDNAKVFEALEDVITDTSIMDSKVARKIIESVVREANEKKAEVEGAKGKAFLEENAKRDEVKVTESGLQYEVIKEGTGKSPVATDTVVCHYKGTLIDGTEFDSSYSRDKPLETALDRVIPGWTEGIQLMKEGAKYKFYIPQELGYGSRPAGNIPAYSTLIFEVELIEVK